MTFRCPPAPPSAFMYPKPEKRSTSKRKRDAVLADNTQLVYEHCYRRENGMCRFCRDGRTMLIEMAHLEGKGMGGDHGNRTANHLCCMLCANHHQGPRSLHSGHITFEFKTDRGADGPITWTLRETL